MPKSLDWNGDAFRRQFERAISRRLTAACAYLAGEIKTDISQSGTLRYEPSTKTGKPSKRQKTIYNFTHSRPGHPPFKQTGHLRRSIAFEVIRLQGRVGTNLLYGRVLETRMNRPFLRPGLIKHKGRIIAIVTATIKPGEIQYGGLPSRSGHLGAGARKAGFS